jgi:hypothetical protein
MKPADEFAQFALPDKNEMKINNPDIGKPHKNQPSAKLKAQSFSTILKTCQRQLWIAEAAYFIAEGRGFLPGQALDDWLKAEKLYIEMLIDKFFEFAREDGEITMTGLRQLAGAVGVKNPAKLYEKTQLINAIQSACGGEPCFKTQSTGNCERRLECPWEPECQKLIARWQR